MPILAMGVSYRRAPVELLERLSFVEDEYPKAYRRLMELDAVREGAILSTCNRAEVFAEVTTYHAGFLDLKRFLCESRDVPPEELAEPLYSHYEDDAADHLFSVAAGIDSMVVGEPQVLAQVRRAYGRAESEGAGGPMLSALFRGAIRAGKRARAETNIGASPSAFIEAGADLAEQALGGLAAKSILVVGAGGMAALAARHLRERGAGHIRILNRSVERAQRVAQQTGGASEPGHLDLLVPAMARADMVVSSTGAAGVIIATASVHAARSDGGSPDGASLDGASLDGGRLRPSHQARQRPLFLLDLAVPRDIDPGVAAIPGVHLVDIDDLKDALASRGPDLATEMDRVREIVAEEVRRFAAWRRAARLAPLIRALRERGDQIKRAELDRAASRLADLTDREREAVEVLAGGIVAKFLHQPIVRLKEHSGPSGSDSYARVLADLFGVELPPRG